MGCCDREAERGRESGGRASIWGWRKKKTIKKSARERENKMEFLNVELGTDRRRCWNQFVELIIETESAVSESWWWF